MGKGRAPCCDKSKVKRGPWSPAEDLKLITFIQKNGHDNWRALPKQSGLLRCGKSCRLRWINYLRPDVKRGNFTNEEEEKIIKLHETLGNKWSKIASHFSGRTDNEIKNVWNTHLKKRLLKIAGRSLDESKESSSILTSSSSSYSTGSILSSRKRGLEGAEVLVEEESDPKRACNNDSREDVDDIDEDSVEKEEGTNEGIIFSTHIEKNPKIQQATLSTTTTTTTSSDSSYGSNMSNGSSTTTITTTTTQVTQVDRVSKLGDHHEDEMLMDGLLLDFDVNAILQEVNQPGDVNNEDSFWDMFGDNSTLLGSTLFESTDREVQVLLENNDPSDENSCRNSGFGKEKTREIENNKDWFRYLESELGLEATTMGNNNQTEQEFDHQAMEILAEECNFSDLDPINPEFSASSTYDLWPSNNLPQNSSAF